MTLNKRILILCFNFQTDSNMVNAKKYILAKHFDGEPKESDIKLVEEELPPLKDNGKYVVIKCSTIYTACS